MSRALVVATLLALSSGAASGQALGVLRVTVTLTDTTRGPIPVPRHLLLISDNPSSSPPRRILTKPDGKAEVSLRPGSYTVESDEPVAFGGKGYQWTQIIQITAGRDHVLALTAENAEVGDPPAVRAAPAAPVESAPSLPSAESPDAPRPFPADALGEAVKRNVLQLNAYQISSSGFDVTFLTPPLLHVARERARKSSLIPESLAVAVDFGEWSDYVAEAPAVLIVRVTPKLTEGFWMTMARMAAYTQGAVIPPIKHFKPGFARLQAFCGDTEVTPIHPYLLARRIPETDAVREGLYVFDPAALGPHCKSVRLVMYSEKAPTKPDARVVDARLIERVWNDFAPVRPPRAAAPIHVMLLDGESGGPYHNWLMTTRVLKKQLDETGLFEVDVVTAPPVGAPFSGFKPDFTNYQVVVLNYDAPDERWPADLKTAFEHYVSNGGGLVLVHASDNAFPGWQAFNDMIGVGGWRDRTENAGPFWFVKDGKLTSDSAPGKAGSHGSRLPFRLTVRDANHPITKGLPAVWMHEGDELYAKMRGPGRNMTVLATAHSDPANKGTGRDEPQLMVLSYGKGRVFHTTLGHDVSALSSVDFVVTFQRGTEWAATGEVTQMIPADFPTADAVRVRANLAAMEKP